MLCDLPSLLEQSLGSLIFTAQASAAALHNNNSPPAPAVSEITALNPFFCSAPLACEANKWGSGVCSKETRLYGGVWGEQFDRECVCDCGIDSLDVLCLLKSPSGVILRPQCQRKIESEVPCCQKRSIIGGKMCKSRKKSRGKVGSVCLDATTVDNNMNEMLPSN